MSSSLSWNPVIETEAEHPSDRLKHILEKEYLDGQTERELDRGAIPFLRGVLAGIASREDEQDLINMIAAIEKYGAINIWLQY